MRSFAIAALVGTVTAAAECPISCKWSAATNSVQLQHLNNHAIGAHGPSTVDAKCLFGSVGGCTDSKVVSHKCVHNENAHTCKCTCEESVVRDGTIQCGASHTTRSSNCQDKTCPTATSKHAVRCCSDTAQTTDSTTMWNKSGTCSVWGGSPGQQNGSCNNEATYQEAKDLCASNNARLCTAQEIEADCTRGSGCGHDGRDVWTAEETCTVVLESSTTSYSKAHDAGGLQKVVAGRALYNKDTCADAATAKHAVRCCSESATKPGPNWTKNSGCSVWADSEDAAGVCHSDKSLEEARTICAGQGARLCSAAELKADCTRGTGCSFDSKTVWTSDGGCTDTSAVKK